MKAMKLICAVMLLMNVMGCWSKTELDEVTFVYGLFFDAGDEPGTIKLTINTPLPNRLAQGQGNGGGTSEGEIFATISKTADTITSALRAIQKDLSRKLSLSRIKVVVIGKEYAADMGLADLLEWMRREPFLPLGTYILAAPAQAADITDLTPMFEQMPSEVLSQFGELNFVLDTTIKHCMIAEASGLGLAINYLSQIKKPGPREKPEKWAAIQGAMLFRNSRMTGILGLKEAQTLSWAFDHISLPEYSLKWEDGKTKASVVFVQNKGRVQVTMKEREPVFTVKLAGRVSVVSKHDEQNRDNGLFGEMILKQLERRISEDMEETLRKTQQAGSDVLLLGSLLEWNYPKTWHSLRKDWTDYYRHDIAIQVDTDFSISDFGSER